MKRWIVCTAIAVALAALVAANVHAGDLPDPHTTPGLPDPEMTAAKLCAKDFRTSAIRNVPESVKRKVYAAYGMAKDKPPCPCEVDHLISLELGGTNDIKNLWPQSYGTMPYNAHVKDVLENRLHKLVCAGTITLKDAQRKIAADWVSAYREYAK